MPRKISEETTRKEMIDMQFEQQEKLFGELVFVKFLYGRIGESARQVEGLFESLLAQSFDGGR